ncbi:cytochrome P450 [Polyangium aurulentum]|uniref:cytochrome P450 n=1 Tax=Polyangium aurulentum TaxID=2567896 RepID=UPI00146D6D3D|nr:cytochrome P450 [Polyangium aurulentum]UQA56173.1 cytochrome P450 [Polyangium aurulentum]
MSHLPPGPRSQIATLARYFRDPIGCMVPLSQKYGDTLLFPGKPPLVVTGDPDGIKAIYTADPDTFEPLNQDFGVFIGARSLLLLGGKEHRRARKLMTPPFHGARMRAYGEQIVRLTEQRTENMRPGQTASMLELMQEISLDVILQVVFGVTERPRMAALARLLLDLTNGISPLVALFPSLRREFGGVGPYARFIERRRRLHAQLDELIAAGRASGPREDILSLLLAARDEDGQPMPDDEIRDQLVLLVVAGHETTAISIAWALYALHQPDNAASLERLRADLSALPPDPDPESLAKLPYLEAVCNETLRRYPLAPAPAPRKLLRPLTLKGFDLPAGGGVAAAIGIAHFREEVYPEPFRFRPERFLERQPSPFEFLPYGGGARRCLGAAMASYEMKLVLGTLLRRSRLRLASLRPDKGTLRAANAGPAHGVRMIVEARAG